LDLGSECRLVNVSCQFGMFIATIQGVYLTRSVGKSSRGIRTFLNKGMNLNILTRLG